MTTTLKLIALVNRYVADGIIPQNQYERLWQKNREQARKLNQLFYQYLTDDNCNVTFDNLVMTLGAVLGYNCLEWSDKLLDAASTKYAGTMKI